LEYGTFHAVLDVALARLLVLPEILLAVVITLLDEAYCKVACWLNDKGG
jgi:hypothetical protein